MSESQPTAVAWRNSILAVAGILIAVAAVGVVGIVINRGVHDMVERAITFHVELEDNADDLRVAVLDVRHYHRDMLFDEPLPPLVREWEERYAALLAEIDELSQLIAAGVDPEGFPSVDGMRSLAEGYYADFRPAVTAFDPDDRLAFDIASEDGLQRLNEIEEMAAAVDRAGEERAEAAFVAIDESATTGILALLAVIAGIGVVGVLLGAVVLRMIESSRRTLAAEQAAVAQLEEAARAKTDFIADASHELRTPLTVLRGNAEVGLAMGHESELTEVLREIVTEAERMTRLVDDLLFLARSDAASVPLELQRVDAGQLLRSLAARAEVLARQRGAQLSAQLEVSGPIQADPARVEQAVLILVDNAAKYGPPGGTVELAARMEGAELVVAVRDHGPGIAAEDLPHIFERFYRRRSGPVRRVPGSGLGLAIASTIVEGHGGRLSAESAVGGGTRVTIRLPLEPVDQAARVEQAAERAAAARLGDIP